MDKIPLPRPLLKGHLSVEEGIYDRISRRNFQDQGLNLAEAGQLLWSAGGLGTAGNVGMSRAAPSAGATYPLELYLVAGKVEVLEPGLYHYDYKAHALTMLKRGDLRTGLARDCLGQGMLAKAPLSIVLVAHYERTIRRYGERGYRYVHMEVGHVSQNIYLQAEALELATVAVGAFNDAAVKKSLAVEGAPLLLMPVGAR